VRIDERNNCLFQVFCKAKPGARDKNTRLRCEAKPGTRKSRNRKSVPAFALEN
jgi:hypothetical protein